MDNVIIRFSNDDDLLQIADIEKNTFSCAWSHKALVEFCSYNTNRIIVAEYENKVAGYITYTKILDEIQIANVAVSLDFRRCNIGTRLIEFLKKDAQNSNCCIITLEVRKSNEAAFNLYKKCGFLIVGNRKNYYSNPQEDAILMNYSL